MPRQQKRWNAVRELLEYDSARGIRGRIRRRLVRIADQTADLVSSSNDDWPLQRERARQRAERS
jgi:hypothetical protein